MMNSRCAKELKFSSGGASSLNNESKLLIYSTYIQLLIRHNYFCFRINPAVYYVSKIYVLKIRFHKKSETMKAMKKLSVLMITALVLFGISSCQKENEQEIADNKMAKEDAIAEAIFDELGEIADQAFRIGGNGTKSNNDDGSRLGDCVTITIDTTSMPHVMIIDFGEVNCLCRDGKWRRGQIIVTFTGRYHQPGTVITQTFNEFYVNDNHVEGTRIMTNLGPNDEGQPQYETIVDGMITMNNSQAVISWEANHLRTWIEGYDTPVWYDNVFLITGSGIHNHSNGGSFVRTILEPLRRELSCHHFVSGIVETVPANRPTRTLDYGDGTCDNIATVTVGNRTFIIRLP
jgi:hypothetical protein